MTGTSRPRSRVDGDADVHELLVDDLVARHVDRGVELRELAAAPPRAIFSAMAVTVSLPPAFSACARVLLAQLLERGDVRLVVLRDVRDLRSTRC